MLPASEIMKALEKGAAERRTFQGLDYIRFKNSYKGIERGTVLFKDGFFPGFPHIERVFTLEKGLERNISDEYVFAEEKIDGYNLRTVLIKGDVFGLSRGGIIDAFSTEKLREIIPKKALADRIMLCGEMIGNTPYTHPSSEYDVRYYVFDVYDLDKGEYLTPEDRYAFLKRNGLSPAPYLGKFHKKNDLKKLKELALNVNKGNKEGIVFKSEDRKHIVKYVNPNADIEDIGNCIKAIFDMPIGHFNQRLLRSAIFVREYGLDHEEYGKRLGNAVFGKFSEALHMLESDGHVYDEFEMRIADIRVWDELKAHMGKEVRLEKVLEKEDNGKIRIRFRKIYVKSSKRLREFLNGKGMTD